MRRAVLSVIGCCISVWSLWAGEGLAFQIVEALPEAEISEGMLMPTDVDFGADGTLYVLDGYQGRILARQPGGEIRVLKPEGACRLDRALGLAAYGTNLYVANTAAGTVCELGPDGACLRTVRMPREKGQSPSAPTDIAIEDDRAVIADRGAQALHICGYPTFASVRSVGAWEPPGGALNSPYLVTMKRQRILVSDMMNGRLVEVAANGDFLNSFGERGVREGQFVRPKGIALGSREQVFVSDSTLGVVQVFDREFRYRGTVGNAGKPLYFEHPAGLAVHQDRLAVVEEKAGRARLLRLRLP